MTKSGFPPTSLLILPTLNTGDIVIAMDRPIISTGLKVARIKEEHAGSLLVQRVARYVPSEFVDGSFVWYLINSQFFVTHAVSQSTGSDLPHISSNDILTTPLPLPPLSEQRDGGLGPRPCHPPKPLGSHHSLHSG